MSAGNFPNATGMIPQYGPGQILVIPPNLHHPQGVTYFVPRSFLEHSNGLQTLPQENSDRAIPQATIQPQHQSPRTLVNRAEKARDLDKTNAKIRNIKEKCISHFIEGQLIIETHRSLVDSKVKSVKKKDKKTNASMKQQKRVQIRRQPTVPSNTVIIKEMPKNHKRVSEQDNGAISDAVTRRIEVDDNIQKIRSEMIDWSVADVVKFIEKHDDIKLYSTKFADDEVDGKALLLMIDRNLNLQWLASMFKHGPAMKIEAVLSRYKLHD